VGTQRRRGAEKQEGADPSASASVAWAVAECTTRWFKRSRGGRGAFLRCRHGSALTLQVVIERLCRSSKQGHENTNKCVIPDKVRSTAEPGW